MDREPVDVFLPLGEDEACLGELAARRAGWSPGEVERVVVIRRSLDARKGHPLGHRLRVLPLRRGEPDPPPPEGLPPPRRGGRVRRVVVVGSGPAGSFAAARLADAGVAVTLVERGRAVQPRRHDIQALVVRGELDPDSNYCFGEGGAGTFSDGKLYTRVKDRRAAMEVLRRLVEHGAPSSILVEQRPHIGSNRLPKVLLALRGALEARGVGYRFGDPVEELLLEPHGVRGVRLRSGEELLGDAVVLATGHSARPIYELCHRHGVALVAKPFAIGCRVEHSQRFVDRAQYGRAADHPALPAAFYELTSTAGPGAAGGRGVYSFCMCPGGWIVAAATEPGGLCTNGMSLSRRDSPHANAALIVTVEPRDLGAGALAGLELQRRLEEAAFAAGGGGFVAPAQAVPDFLAGRDSAALQRSSYRPGIVAGRLDRLLPPFVVTALAAGLRRFDRLLPGFASRDGQLVGVETRSSAPLRILREPASLMSPSHRRLFPVGEGAGYAGGIVSAAIDGLRVADAILDGG